MAEISSGGSHLKIQNEAKNPTESHQNHNTHIVKDKRNHETPFSHLHLIVEHVIIREDGCTSHLSSYLW